MTICLMIFLMVGKNMLLHKFLNFFVVSSNNIRNRCMDCARCSDSWLLYLPKIISLSLKLVMQMTLGGLTITLRVLFCGVMIVGSVLCFLRGLWILLTRGAGKGGRSVAVSNLFTSQ